MRSSIALFLAVTLTAAAAQAGDKKGKKTPAPAGPAAPAAPAAPAGDGKGLVSLTVVCATPGAAIYVDGEQIAETPMDLPVPVTPGDHSIKITRLGFAPYIDVFSTKGKPSVKVEAELLPVAGVLHVKSDVPGSRVLIDGKYVGEAPLDLEVDVGARAVAVSKSCHKEFFKNVMAVAGQEQTVAAALPEDLTPDGCRPPAPEVQKWYKKPWVWGVIAGAAVLAGGGAAAGAYLGTRDPLGGADFLYTNPALATW